MGQHPETGEDIHRKSGRFGPYIEVEEDGKKFLRVGIEPLAENGIIMGPSPS